MYVGLWEQY